MKTQEYGVLLFFGFFLPEVISQFDFWEFPQLSALFNQDYNDDENGNLFSNNPQSISNPKPQLGESSFSTNFIGNRLKPDASLMSNELGCKQSPLSCSNSKYRTHDGSCNNLIVPAIGTPQTPYSRLAPPNYGDGISTPSLAKSKNPLPLARLLSLTLHPDAEATDPKFTLLSMQYGQFITHDMSLLTPNSDVVDCCEKATRRLPQCFPIILPSNDPQTLASGRTCMNFVRSVTDRDLNCIKTNKPAEQITEVNHFLDLSHIYGNSEETNQRLRENQGGRLMVARRDGKDWLPQNPNVSSACPAIQSLNEPCYFAGDTRSNQNAHLAVLHTMQMREHNRIARILESINHHWDDEKLYQEARRIAIAQHQVISYYEWLPLILGVQNSIDRRIIYNTVDYVNDYDERINPAVSNEHANAASRYYHTLIAGNIDFITDTREKAGSVRLSDWFNRPAIIENGNFDFLLRGVATQPESHADDFLTSEITQFLFRPPGPTFGFDLRATDIQRARDHGLAPYNEYRQQCGLQRAFTFRDFEDVISQENSRKLESLYESPDDVDLMVGGSLEKLVDGALAGPTFLCILTEQFFRTRVGDRFFFENSAAGFSLEQLGEIRKVSISRLICDNGDNIKRMQEHGFQRISENNPVVSCDKLPFVNWNAWKQTGF